MEGGRERVRGVREDRMDREREKGEGEREIKGGISECMACVEVALICTGLFSGWALSALPDAQSHMSLSAPFGFVRMPPLHCLSAMSLLCQALASQTMASGRFRRDLLGLLYNSCTAKSPCS